MSHFHAIFSLLCFSRNFETLNFRAKNCFFAVFPNFEFSCQRMLFQTLNFHAKISFLFLLTLNFRAENSSFAVFPIFEFSRQKILFCCFSNFEFFLFYFQTLNFRAKTSFFCCFFKLVGTPSIFNLTFFDKWQNGKNRVWQSLFHFLNNLGLYWHLWWWLVKSL